MFPADPKQYDCRGQGPGTARLNYGPGSSRPLTERGMRWGEVGVRRKEQGNSVYRKPAVIICDYVFNYDDNFC